MCSSEDPAAADESSTTQESPVTVRGFQPQCHLPGPATPAGEWHMVFRVQQWGTQVAAQLPGMCILLPFSDWHGLQNVLFINGGEYLYIPAAFRIPFNNGPDYVTESLGTQHSECFLPHSAISIFPSQIAFIGPKIHSVGSSPNTVQVNKPEISCQLERGKGNFLKSWTQHPSLSSWKRKLANQKV